MDNHLDFQNLFGENKIKILLPFKLKFCQIFSKLEKKEIPIKILAVGHFVNWSFHQQVILSTGHFIK
jgi:hypothetical protein